MAGALTLVANPGSTSRKYAVYEDTALRAQLHVEWANDRVVASLADGQGVREIQHSARSLREIPALLHDLLHANGVLGEDDHIARIGLRIVAPSGFFLEDHTVTDAVVRRLENLLPRAPLHISTALAELKQLRIHFRNATIIGVSDSAFHAGKPDRAWNYGLPLAVADRLEIKRFGYHGLSAASVVRQLREVDVLAPKTIVVHLGSGASVTAVQNGKSIDNTMGYSPLEGVIMSTRSGSLDPTAVLALKDGLDLTDRQLDVYLNTHSGLRGLGGSDDIRELLEREAHGSHIAHLALETYMYSVRKAIGQMAGALGGADAVVFTGTVGERSAPIRGRVSEGLQYLGLVMDEEINRACESPASITRLNNSGGLLLVAPADEAGEIARHISRMVRS